MNLWCINNIDSTTKAIYHKKVVYENHVPQVQAISQKFKSHVSQIPRHVPQIRFLCSETILEVLHLFRSQML
jgi:hypothetical protein